MHTLAIEGLDGSGKTSCAERVAARLGGVCATSLPAGSAWRLKRSQVNLGADVEARFNFFIALNHMQLDAARSHEAGGFVSTLDSSIYRTVATHRVLGSQAAREHRIAACEKPDSTYYLQVPENLRQQRLSIRDGGIVHPSHWDEILFERSDDVRAEYAKLGLVKLTVRFLWMLLLTRFVQKLKYNS